jgi:hypothetical protein
MDMNRWLDLLAELEHAKKSWHPEDLLGMMPGQVSAILENESIGQYVWDNSRIAPQRGNIPIKDWEDCRIIYFEREQDITLFRLLK